MSVSANFPNVRPSLLLDFANSQQLDPRVTFSRSTTAPYYDGKTSVLAEQNLVLYSQDFTNAIWTKNGTTVTANSNVAPDGNTTGNLISASGTNLNAIYQAITFTNGLNYTVSIYAKAGTKSVLQIDSAGLGSGYGRANFDLTNGVLGTVDASFTASIVSANNGWYRCIVTFLGNGSTGNFVFSMQDSTTAAREANSTAGNFYLWGVQAEQRSSVTAYNATTTSALTNYIPQLLTAPINQPRFDFNPTTGESLGLLIEQSSTNLLTYSSDFSNAGWNKIASSITTTANIAPDGTQTAQLLVPSTSSTQHYMTQIVSSSGTVTLSIYAKAYGYNYLGLTASGGTFSAFNLSNGTLGIVGSGCTNTITSVGNGWYRCTVTCAYVNTINYIFVENGNGQNTWSGDGYSGIYIWGAQLEALAFPTSYIPTTSAQVTRASDKAVILNVSGIYNATQGTILTQGTQNSSFGQNYPLASFSDGSLTNKLYIELYGAVTYGIVGNSATLTGQSVGAIKTPFKMALAAQTNDAQLCTNGTLNQSSSSLTMPPNISELDIGCFINFGSQIRTYNGCISKIAYYPIRVTNTQLQSLTGS